jgi:hypothetical protein
MSNISILKLNGKSLLVAFAAVMAAFVSVLALNTQPAAAAGECGSSYAHLANYQVMSGAQRVGTIETYWSSSKGNNCAIYRCYGNACGAGVQRTVAIKRSYDPSWTSIDQGWYYSYAGPVYSRYSRGACIDVYAKNQIYSGAGLVIRGERYLNNVHCG